MDSSSLLEELENSLEEFNLNESIESPLSHLYLSDCSNSTLDSTITSTTSGKVNYTSFTEETLKKIRNFKELLRITINNEIQARIHQFKTDTLEELIIYPDSPVPTALQVKCSSIYYSLVLKNNDRRSFNLTKALGIDENVSSSEIDDKQKQLLLAIFKKKIDDKCRVPKYLEFLESEEYNVSIMNGCMINDSQETLLNATIHLYEQHRLFSESIDHSIKILNNMLFIKMTKMDEHFNSELKLINEKLDFLNEQIKNVRKEIENEILRHSNIEPAVKRLKQLQLNEVEETKAILIQLRKKKLEYDKLKGTEFDEICDEFAKVVSSTDQQKRIQKVLARH